MIVEGVVSLPLRRTLALGKQFGQPLIARVQVVGQQLGLIGNTYSSVTEAYETALKESGQDDFIFVGGSNYVVAEFLKTAL